MDQSDIQATQYSHQQHNSKHPLENGRLSGAALSQQPLSANQHSRSPVVQLKSGAREYRANERRILAAKMRHNAGPEAGGFANGTAGQRYVESRDSE